MAKYSEETSKLSNVGQNVPNTAVRQPRRGSTHNTLSGLLLSQE